MPYQYRGNQHSTVDWSPAELEFMAARDRLAAATAEAYPHRRNGHNVVLITPHDTGITEVTARRLATITRLLPLVKTRRELLEATGYTDDAIRAAVRLHKLKRLYKQYRELPIDEGKDPIVAAPDGHRIKLSTLRRFQKAQHLTNTTDMTRVQIAQAAGWHNESSFHRACQRHGYQALWAGVKTPRRGHPPGISKSTKPRLEDLQDLLRDPHTSAEEALQRTGWKSYASFERFAYRHKRPDLLRELNSRRSRIAA